MHVAPGTVKPREPRPLTDEEHASIVDAMLSEQAPDRDFDEPKPWCGAPLNQEIDAECQAIFRNPGEGDEETERLEAKLDQELLEEDDDEV